jgi:putative peptide zinc metalloprotease protein
MAPGVELSGAMEDSAFEEPPWLILRGDAFIRLTELLYRVVEQADGKRTIGQIAEAVSKATGRAISEDNVRKLVRDRLIPLGLIAKADGTVAKGSDGGPSRSPLQIGMRTAQIPGRVLEPVAQVFKVLFMPPILLGVVAAGLVAMGWVFLLHGVGEGLRTAVYEPWLILALLPIIIGSAAFRSPRSRPVITTSGGVHRAGWEWTWRTAWSGSTSSR